MTTVSRVQRALRRGRYLGGIALLLGAASCAPILKHPSPTADVQQDQQIYLQQGYQLQAGDQIFVHHLIDADYDALINVGPDGRAVLPGLAKPLKVADRTVEDIKAELTRRYHDEAGIMNPSFSFDVKATGSPYIYVGGEVERPGYLDVAGHDRTLLQVLAAAGGWLPTARKKEVLVVRQGLDGKQLIFSANLEDILDGSDLEQNVLLRPKDTVLVPPSDIASLDRWVDQYIRQALPVPTSASASAYYGYDKAVR